jgi:hypothetical protein
MFFSFHMFGWPEFSCTDKNIHTRAWECTSCSMGNQYSRSSYGAFQHRACSTKLQNCMCASVPIRSCTMSFSRLPFRFPTRLPTETAVWYSYALPFGLYDRGGLFNVYGFECPCFSGRGPYRETRGTTAWAPRDDRFQSYGSLQQA